MVVEKRQILYGSDVAAPTILNPAESENGSFCAYAENRKSPVIWGFFVLSATGYLSLAETGLHQHLPLIAELQREEILAFVKRL